MSEFQTSMIFLYWICIAVFIYVVIGNALTERRVKKQRSKSSTCCYYCGEPMLESDVFCESCWKITPKLKKMLSDHPEFPPTYYSNISYRTKRFCPHCRSHYSYSSDTNFAIRLGTPIKGCSICNNYFLDTWDLEWSVASPIIKLRFLFIPIIGIFWLSIYYFILFFMYHPVISFLAFLPPLLLLIRFPTRKAFHNSFARLNNNPEYPKFLVDMNYIGAMDKKYYHLSKEPILSRKDKFKKLKEFLKEAFTFD